MDILGLIKALIIPGLKGTVEQVKSQCLEILREIGGMECGTGHCNVFYLDPGMSCRRRFQFFAQTISQDGR